MPYNFAADSFHTKKLCSRLSSSEVHFLIEIGRFAFLGPPLEDLGATYDDRLRLIVSEYSRRPLRSSTDRTLTVSRTHNRFGAKIIGGGDPLYQKFWIKVTALVQNRRFSIYFRS